MVWTWGTTSSWHHCICSWWQQSITCVTYSYSPSRQIGPLLTSHHHLQIPSHSLFRHIQLLANVLERSMPGETKPDYSPEESTIFCGIYTISFLQHWNVGHILHQIPQTLSSLKLCRICNWGQHNLLEELWRQNNLARSFLLFLLLSQLLHLTEQYL